MMISEADTAVERFLAQPHRLEIRVEGGRRRLDYFPDLMRRMADGTIEIIEVKKSRDEIDADPDYAFKIAKAARVYEAVGLTLRIVTADDDVDIDPLLPNAQSIFADKFAYIGTRERLAMEETFEAKGAIAHARQLRRSRPREGSRRTGLGRCFTRSSARVRQVSTSPGGSRATAQ
ncbi:hypothetical protein [Bradyrhizobium viridifuturi]|uniref:hypothetical protein n=1 Tax=Bradyrhizobium viridifuturi TaxID=1654716 RepID=UPI000FE142BF|nr:hypothetical protein [Bradyrhizobium viridifuturi]